MKPYISFREAKQVGTLYHFTSSIGLLGILTSNYIDIGMDGNVSFTRDKNFNKIFRHKIAMGGRYDVEAFIEIDGDKLSENYKIRPYDYYGNLDYSMGPHQGSLDEREEIVNKPIKNIKNYIESVNIIKSKFNKDDNRLLKYINNRLKIEINTININQYKKILQKYYNKINIV